MINYQISSHYSSFATVRFDTKEPEDIQFGTVVSINGSIHANLPDPSLGFSNYTTGSDVYNVIENLLSYSNICGSRMVILVKRYPNRQDISGIVNKLRYHHALVTFIVSNSPSGGDTVSRDLYDIASKTNGFCAFNDDFYFHITITNVPGLAHPYQTYSVNVKVSGVGTRSLPIQRAPDAAYYYHYMTIQEQRPHNSFQNITLQWANLDDPTDFQYVSVDEPYIYYHFKNGNFFDWFYEYSKGNYTMNLKFNYTDTDVHTLQIRTFRQEPVDFWIPYQD
uniref:Structural protein n=1 Tax=Caenorhabditis tropicalis TaxID=1561998 RepID=A0A1I7TTP2_9PELO